MTPLEQLELALRRFADAAVGGDDAAARLSFIAAQALMPVLRSCAEEAAEWVAAELAAAGLVDAEVEALSVRRQQTAWDVARRKAGASS